MRGAAISHAPCPEFLATMRKIDVKLVVLVLKVVWLALSLMVLAVTLYFFDGKPNSDVAVFLYWAMFILAFPISWVVYLIYAGILYALYELFSWTFPESYGGLFLDWLLFAVAGYLQWFKLLPLLIGKIRNSRQEAQ